MQTATIRKSVDDLISFEYDSELNSLSMLVFNKNKASNYGIYAAAILLTSFMISPYP